MRKFHLSSKFFFIDKSRRVSKYRNIFLSTIVEEVDEPRMTKKLKQSHVSSEEVVSSTTTVVTSTVRKTKSKEAVRRSNQISPKKLTKSTRKSKEVTQNEENMLLETSIEAIRQNTSTNGSPSMNFAYKEYVEAGEYWNKYPKTDYTYSELSAYRREVAPGTIGMPNMSRKSLELHHDRVVTMIQKNPEEESFIRKRYQAASVAPPPTFATSLQYDSGDELDYNHFQRKTVLSSSLVQRQTMIRRFWTLITTIVTTIVYFPVQVFKKSDESLYRTRYEEKGKCNSIFLFKKESYSLKNEKKSAFPMILIHFGIRNCVFNEVQVIF